MTGHLTAELIDDVARQTGVRLHGDSWATVGGGDINTAARVTDEHDRNWFIKLNTAERADMFAAEAEGLQILEQTNTVAVPEVLAFGSTDGQAWLLMEWLDLVPASSDASLGMQLAQLHGASSAAFGWHRDNFIGRTSQSNQQNQSWPNFFAEQRLQTQLELAASRGAPASLLRNGDQLLNILDDWLQDYAPVPSLLHGDLWGGNKGTLSDGRPVIFDPAVYFGDREADIAMTRLFGGFSPAFYTAYEAEWPLDKDAWARQALYNLYHILNHFNMFGGGYAGQAEQMMRKLLSEHS